MPNVQPAVNTFTAEIKLLEESFERDLKALTVKLKKMTDTELIQATSQLNFFQEIVDKGYGSALDVFGEFVDSFAKTTLLYICSILTILKTNSML